MRLHSPGSLYHLQRGEEGVADEEGAAELFTLVDGDIGSRFESICVRKSRYNDHTLGAIKDALAHVHARLLCDTQQGEPAAR